MTGLALMFTDEASGAVKIESFYTGSTVINSSLEASTAISMTWLTSWVHWVIRIFILRSCAVGHTCSSIIIFALIEHERISISPISILALVQEVTDSL
jgi:hypothetical protein